MSRNERFWKETMDNLDEKYVNETSEELFEHLGEKRELVEIHVDRQEKKKKSFGVWIGAAAALAVIVGTAAVLRMTILSMNPNSGIKITLSSEATSTTSVFAAPETTEMTLPVPEGHSPSMQNFDGIEIYENIFWGSWSNSAETIRFTYKEDPLPEEAVAAAVTKQDEGYFLQVYGQGDYGLDVKIGVYYIPADETDKMYFYEDEESTTAQVYTRRWQEAYPDNGLILESGKLNFIGQQKLAREMCFEESDGFYYLRRIYETPLYNADGERLDIVYGTVRLGENIVASKKLNEFTLTVNCKYSDSDIYEQITLSLSRGEKSWKIASASDAAGNIYKTDLMAGSTELIDASVLDGDGIASKESLALLEETFYGTWESDFDTLSLTYTEDNQYPGNTRITSLIEREDGWYLNEFTGGTGTLYFIAREEPEKMYRYEDFTGAYDVAKNNYYCIYRLKSRGSTEISKGVISLLGMKKIFVKYGVDIWDIMPENIQRGGEEYNYGDWYWGYGDTYINEHVTDSRIVFSHRYCKVGGSIDEVNMPDMKYFTFTVEKIDGVWKITDTTEYVPLGVSDDYEVEYFNDKTGKYYALATFIAMDSHDTSALYFWDGTSYNKVSDGFVNSRTAEIDGVVYILYYETEDKTLRLRAYSGDEPYENTLVCDMSGIETVFPNSYSMRAVGDYIVVYYEEPGAETMRVSLFSKYLDLSGKTTENYVTEISDSGFKMVIDGKEITYTTDENDLEGQLWHLNRSSGMLFSKVKIASPMIDSDDSFTQNYKTYYRVIEHPFTDYSSLREFLNEIFTENACDDIETEMFIGNSSFKTNDGYIYSVDGARGADIYVGDVTCRIKEQTDTQAVLEYTVYGIDENLNVSSEVIETYEITAVNDGNGWRLERLYSPY